jgi:hypothetical protein
MTATRMSIFAIAGLAAASLVACQPAPPPGPKAMESLAPTPAVATSIAPPDAAQPGYVPGRLPAIIDLTGGAVAFDGQKVTLDQLGARLDEEKAAQPNALVIVTRDRAATDAQVKAITDMITARGLNPQVAGPE